MVATLSRFRFVLAILILSVDSVLRPDLLPSARVEPGQLPPGFVVGFLRRDHPHPIGCEVARPGAATICVRLARPRLASTGWPASRAMNRPVEGPGWWRVVVSTDVASPSRLLETPKKDG